MTQIHNHLRTIMYVGNIIVAGTITILALFVPHIAQEALFATIGNGTYAVTICGCHWAAITVLSVIGLLWRPLSCSLVFVHQLLYKSLFLLFGAIPAMLQGREFPWQMSIFFLVWICLLPFAVPWKYLFAVITEPEDDLDKVK